MLTRIAAFVPAAFLVALLAVPLVACDGDQEQDGAPPPKPAPAPPSEEPPAPPPEPEPEPVQACTGSVHDLELGGASRASSLGSAFACHDALHARADRFCVNQDLPDDCAGDCTPQKCQPFGMARTITGTIDYSTNPVTVKCESKAFFCACRCR